ncbi:MAG TPA: EAL domain-containing protein [Devosiaceae bacterium]|jgi:diguanylate cyclase (GGDEF)-like protein|nr:EAL domain-containing protein [Devosiaceae bacterium]
MIGRVRHATTLGILAIALLAAALGWLKPIDQGLRDLRFLADEREPTGSVVFLEIDAKSLSAVGVWPWPRRLHATVVDLLMEMGAAEVAFDIDFSTTSTEVDDKRFAAALEDAGGYVSLAAFRQPDSHGSRETFNLPIEQFRQHASPVTVNVPVEGSGSVRSYFYGLTLGGIDYPSLASVLAQAEGPPNAEFPIDFSINPSHIDRISVIDLLSGAVAPERVLDRQVVIGASALELRDTFVVPVHGVLAGGMVQILAAETLRQGRVLTNAGLVPVAGIVVLLALISLVARRRMRLPGAITGALAAAVSAECVAYLLQVNAGLLLDTATVHLMLFGLVLDAIRREVRYSRMLQARAARERDANRVILNRVIADNFDGVIVVGEDDRIIAASHLAEELIGAGLRGALAEIVLPAEFQAAVQRAVAGDWTQDERHPSEMLLAQPEGEPRRIEYTVTLSEVEQGTAGLPARRVACVTFRDITERRRDEERLQFLAGHDPLTGALSRPRLTEIIEELMSADAERAAGLVVVMMDLGRFKTVNDTLGHSYGDMVLKQVVGRLRAAGVDTVARLGGDSFALLLRGERGEDEMRSFFSRLLQRIAEPYQLRDGHQAIISASAGATTSSLSGHEAEVLLSHADMALSMAKSLSGNQFAVFTPEMDELLTQKQDMELALGEAIEKGQLSLVFQPQVALATGETVGVEALLRWQHPVLGVVSPARFIPAAEETGQIIEIGRWVLQAACREVASWPVPTRLAINVSPIQFELVDMVEEVRTALSLSGLPPERLDIEITEGIFIASAGPVIEALQRLRDLGVGVALDDFGTGYSSLSYLGRLPLDKIKIDQSFVRNLPHDAESGAIVRAVMTLSETLDKVVVAEGIENADQAWMLQMMGCHVGQGYHYSRPRTAAQMMEWFEDQLPARRVAAR